MICGGANDTSGCHLAVFSEGLAVARHFVAARPPGRNASGIDYPSKKNYLKWRAIQLAIHSTVGPWVEYKYL